MKSKEKILRAEDLPPTIHYDYTTIPDKYDIVYALFPFDDKNTHKRRYKYRTCLVCDTAHDPETRIGTVTVAYGSSKKLWRRPLIDLVIEEPMAIGIGLMEATKFELDKTELLEWCYPRFAIPDWGDSLILGWLPERMVHEELQWRLHRISRQTC